MRRKLLVLYILLLFILNLSPRTPSAPVAHGDKVVHFLEFLTLGFLGWPAFLYLLPLPFLLEFLQLFVPGRTFSPYDMAANLIGFGFGVLLGWWYGGRHEGASLHNEGRD